MERLLSRMMECGWISEFAVLPGGIHVRWTDSGMAVAWAFSRALVILSEPGSDACETLRNWLLSRGGNLEALEELRPFLQRQFIQLADCSEGEPWNVFLQLCGRDAPWEID